MACIFVKRTVTGTSFSDPSPLAAMVVPTAPDFHFVLHAKWHRADCGMAQRHITFAMGTKSMILRCCLRIIAETCLADALTAPSSCIGSLVAYFTLIKPQGLDYEANF